MGQVQTFRALYHAPVVHVLGKHADYGRVSLPIDRGRAAAVAELLRPVSCADALAWIAASISRTISA